MPLANKRNVTEIQTTYVKQQQFEQQIAFKRRRGLVKRLAFFGIFASTIIFLMASALISQSTSIDEKRSEKERLDRELAELKQTRKILEDEVVKLNDEEYIIKIARRDYFLSNDGEVIFKLPDESASY